MVPYIGRCWWNIWNDHFDRISPRLVGWTRQALEFHNIYPTSGVIAVLLALHSCDNTRLYGFGPAISRDCAKYFGDCIPLRSYLHGHGGWHNFRHEYIWLAALTRNFSSQRIESCTDEGRLRPHLQLAGTR